MKTKQIILSFVLIFGVSINSQAQFWKKIMDKAEDKIEREAERRTQRRVNKKIDKVFDKTEEEIDGVGKNDKTPPKNSSGNDEEMSGMMNDILNSNKDVKIENSYTFNVSATMQITDLSKKNGKTTEMIQSYGKRAIMSTLTEPDNIIINDFDNEAAIMIEPTSNIARIMSMAWMKKMMGQDANNDEESNSAKLNKTGATKTLNGYTCYQYIITDEDIKIDAWFAPGVNFNYQDYLSGMNKMFGAKKTNTATLLNQGQGYVMEMVIYKKGKVQTQMKVTKLSEIPITINMKDYSVQKMF